MMSLKVSEAKKNKQRNKKKKTPQILPEILPIDLVIQGYSKRMNQFHDALLQFSSITME